MVFSLVRFACVEFIASYYTQKMQKAFVYATPSVVRPVLTKKTVVVRAIESPSNGSRPSISFDDLVDVIKAVDTSDVVELELKGKKFSMTVRKLEAMKVPEPVYVQMSSPQAGMSASILKTRLKHNS